MLPIPFEKFGIGHKPIRVHTILELLDVFALRVVPRPTRVDRRALPPPWFRQATPAENVVFAKQVRRLIGQPELDRLSICFAVRFSGECINRILRSYPLIYEALRSLIEIQRADRRLFRHTELRLRAFVIHILVDVLARIAHRTFGRSVPERFPLAKAMRPTGFVKALVPDERDIDGVFPLFPVPRVDTVVPKPVWKVFLKEHDDMPVGPHRVVFGDLTHHEIAEFQAPVSQLFEIFLAIRVSQDRCIRMAYVVVFIPSVCQGNETRNNTCLTFGNASTNPVINSVFETLPAFSTCGGLAVVQYSW